MAAKKAARRAARRTRSTAAPSRRKTSIRRKTARARPGKAARRPSRRPKPRPKAAQRRRPARKTRPAKHRRIARRAPRAVTPRPAASVPPPRPAAPAARPPKPTPAPRPRPQAARPALDRARRTLPEAERGERRPEPDRMAEAARSGGDELRHLIEIHTEASPALTAGDVDAKWDEAYAVGDEAPGGDNPTPDQDRVDDIGKALGVNYDANEELQGSDKIVERDRHRWELDPASSDDWPHNKD